MSELKIRAEELPLPLNNYAYLLINKKSPYYEIIQYLKREMEFRYKKAGKPEIIYGISPRRLAKEIELMVQEKKKITTYSICRTILAACYLCKLKEGEDFWITTTAGGKKNYHFKVNQKTLGSFAKIL